MSAPNEPLKRAIEVLRNHFKNKHGDPIKTPYYLSQLQVLYETDFFPWIVSDAIKQLCKEEFLTKLDKNDIPQLGKLKYVSRINFYINSSLTQNTKDLERVKKRALTIANLVNEYSNPEIARMLGKHLESLVQLELRAQRFKILGISSNLYINKKWTKTNHTLDIIAEHETGKLAIGVEVKNTLDLIGPDEIDIKIDMCEYLGLVPVFAVRWIKPYIECIRRQGGFSWIFKTQIYPFGQEKFVDKLYKKLSVLNKTNSKNQKLKFPATCRGNLPEKSVQKFEEWVNRAIDNIPQINTKYRCRKFTSTDEKLMFNA